MEIFAHINVSETRQRMADGEVAIVDIRDEQSFLGGHIDGAFHLTNGTLSQFMQQVEFATPVIVCCYRGHSSQQAAQFLIHQGYDEVYSLDGGYELWRQSEAL